ncbi:hypothetical protein [Psychrobacter sp. CAL346-MNA-CIBAN-0220]|uniref:hypothetical protein n=1 Tax=Psychrobacter sp. CAL346-MNA-CIBAN-0220 TaxID=3140457 RepID=UPI00332DD0B2
MLPFHHTLAFSTIKSALGSTVIISSILLLTGCDSQNKTADNTAPAQTEHSGNAVAESATVPIDTVAVETATTEANSEPLTTTNQQAVSPLGYAELSFGQIITPKILANRGLSRGDNYNEQCYYVSNPKLSYIDREYGERASVLYQIIDDKVASIVIQDPTTLFYVDISVGDSVDEVMTTHNNNLVYEVDKYDQSGNYYHLIHDITDERATTNSTNQVSTVNDLPLQIKYNIVNGKKVINTASDTDIELDKWTPSQLAQLQGNVETIEIGIPAAIRLTEGCS